MLRPAFIDACASRGFARLAAAVRGTTGVLLVGFPERRDGRRANALAVIRDGRVVDVYLQAVRLPNYTVFDEDRYFDPVQQSPCVIDVDGGGGGGGARNSA